jgi:hypothetical protein
MGRVNVEFSGSFLIFFLIPRTHSSKKFRSISKNFGSKMLTRFNILNGNHCTTRVLGDNLNNNEWRGGRVFSGQPVFDVAYRAFMLPTEIIIIKKNKLQWPIPYCNVSDVRHNSRHVLYSSRS